MKSDDESTNLEIFRDCLSAPLIEKFATEPTQSKGRRSRGHGRKKSHVPMPDSTTGNNSDTDAEELSEFIDYIATEVFTSLPSELRTLTFSTYINTPTLHDRYSLPLTASAAADILSGLDPTLTDTLAAYGLLPCAPSSAPSPTDFLHPILNAYLSHVTALPPPPSATKCFADGCEICLREHVPLTYHHLIPKAVHEKAVKRGWYRREELASVAWLCRACHSFVHGTWGHEVLARELFTVERLVEREECRRWKAWVGRVRWKAR